MTPTKIIKCAIAAAWYQQKGTRLRGRITVQNDECTIYTIYGAYHGLRDNNGWHFTPLEEGSKPTPITPPTVATKALLEQVKAILPSDWKVEANQYPHAGSIWIKPPSGWVYSSSCYIDCSGTNVHNVEQARACMEYWDNLAPVREEFREYVTAHGGCGLLPGHLSDMTHQQLPRFT